MWTGGWSLVEAGAPPSPCLTPSSIRNASRPLSSGESTPLGGVANHNTVGGVALWSCNGCGYVGGVANHKTVQRVALGVM